MVHEIGRCCGVCSKSLDSPTEEEPEDQNPPIVVHAPLLSKHGDHGFHYSCIRRRYFSNPYCPKCGEGFPVPYKDGYFRIVTAFETQEAKVLREVMSSELERWQDAHYRIPKASLEHKINQERGELADADFKRRDEVLLQAVWKGYTAIVDRLIREEYKNTLSCINIAIGIALRLNHKEIFEGLFKKFCLNLNGDARGKLLTIAVDLMNTSAVELIVGYNCGVDIPVDILYGGLKQVCESERNRCFIREFSKIVEILTSKLCLLFDHSQEPRGRDLLYEMMESANANNDLYIINVLGRAIGKSELSLYKFVNQGLEKGWSRSLILQVLSEPGEEDTPFEIYGGDKDKLAASSIHRAIQSEDKEVFSLILKRKVSVHPKEVDRLWLELNHLNPEEIVAYLQKYIPPLPSKWQMYWQEFRNWLRKWYGKLSSCFSRVGASISHCLNLLSTH